MYVGPCAAADDSARCLFQLLYCNNCFHAGGTNGVKFGTSAAMLGDATYRPWSCQIIHGSEINSL